jgi:RimJ/RimL family protein N-acetyltransferase
MADIRPARQTDAERFLRLCNTLDEETTFRLLEAGERTTSVEGQHEILARIEAKENDVILVAEVDGQLVGYIAAMGGQYRRNRHAAHVVISVLQAFSGQGIGTQLIQALERWAAGHGIHRLELTVMAHNERAIGLYRKRGFQIEGRKRHALLIEGAYVDEYIMSKLLD